jgi:hypothetical protein
VVVHRFALATDPQQAVGYWVERAAMTTLDDLYAQIMSKEDADYILLPAKHGSLFVIATPFVTLAAAMRTVYHSSPMNRSAYEHRVIQDDGDKQQL